MKKLMIAMAAIAVGFAANAASVQWSIGQVSSTTENALSGKGQYMAYIFLTTATGATDTLKTTTLAAVKDELAKGTSGDIASLAAFSGANTKYLSSTKRANFSLTTDGFKAGTDMAGFAVIIDSTSQATASSYMLAISATTKEDSVNGTIGDSGVSLLLDYGSQVDSGATWTSLGGGSSVPEPTSGMLLMFGLATLALRRRRA